MLQSKCLNKQEKLFGRKKRSVIFGDAIHVPKMTKDKEAVTDATNAVISKVFEELKSNI